MPTIDTPMLKTLAHFLDVTSFRHTLIASNMANIDTPGFRRRRLQFQDLLYQNLVMPGAAATQQTTYAAGLQIGLGHAPRHRK
jgi:flagellar basal-body rod protein FlgG